MKNLINSKYPQNIYRQRLLEAVVFFAQKSKIKYPSKMMIYKLLAEIDFRHFEETGLPITNLNYRAFRWGPVPQEFHDEITKDKAITLPEDFQNSLLIEEIKFEKNKKECTYFKYVSKRKPELKIFSPRQLRIMEEVAFIYKDSPPTEASKASHEPNKAWAKTMASKGEGAKIDLIETIKVGVMSKEMIKERINEREAMTHNYGV